MAIRYLEHSKINKQAWDNCIQQSFNGIIYAYSWYLDVVCPNWEALVEDEYKSIMPLTKAVKYKFHYLYQPFFTQQLGVFSVDKLSEEKINSFLQFIPEKYKFIEINLNTYNKFSSSNFEIKTSITYEMDLIKAYQNHYFQYSENLCRNLKKAEKQKLEISKEASAREIINMFRQNRGRGIDTLKSKHYEILEHLIHDAIGRGRGQIWGVKTRESKLCAGAFFVESNGKVIFLFSASNSHAKINGAMAFLIDRFIFENAQRNLVLDFEGSNDIGLGRFYNSFGAKKCLYLQIRKNKLPLLVKWMK